MISSVERLTVTCALCVSVFMFGIRCKTLCYLSHTAERRLEDPLPLHTPRAQPGRLKTRSHLPTPTSTPISIPPSILSDLHWCFPILFSRFPQIPKIGNIGIDANVVFQYICNILI